MSRSVTSLHALATFTMDEAKAREIGAASSLANDTLAKSVSVNDLPRVKVTRAIVISNSANDVEIRSIDTTTIIYYFVLFITFRVVCFVHFIGCK